MFRVQGLGFSLVDGLRHEADDVEVALDRLLDQRPLHLHRHLFEARVGLNGSLLF